MELTIENLRTLASSGEIFLTAHSQARLYERDILLADIRQAIQSERRKGNEHDLLFLQRRNEAQHHHSHGTTEKLRCRYQKCSLHEV